MVDKPIKTMRLGFILFSCILVSSCDNSTLLENTGQKEELNLLPAPKMVHPSSSVLVLSEDSRLYTADEDLAPLLHLFSSEVKKLTGIGLESTPAESRYADVLFEIDPSLEHEEYHLEVDRTVRAKGGSYRAVALATSTLLQLSFVREGSLAFPVVSIRDYPDAAYRGLLIDLARTWNSLESVKRLIDMAAYYKTNFVQLHFTDDQSYTLPSRAYPRLSTSGRSYSREELVELEAYSQLRGVTIVPELEIPGHSSQFVQKYPEIFSIRDVEDNPRIINMGKEEVYEALDTLIGEICEVFRATPYFHIGGDETILKKVTDDPDVQAYMRTHALGEDVHELYRHFLVRLNEIVKRHQKQMCVWEGFQRGGEVAIPGDILVFEFETNRYLPDHLVEDGYTVVNTSWKPLYVVNEKKWEPQTIYNWNMWRWENWWTEAPSFDPIQLEETDLIIGAQMCSWEQPEQIQIPSLRRRLPALNERIWNTREVIPYEVFMSRLERTDAQLSLLIGDNRQDTLLIDYNFEE